MANPSKVRVGLVLPEAYFGEAEWQNAENALKYADEAASKGVELLLYPEGYPGPATGPLNNPKYPFKPFERLAEKAKGHGMYIIAGDVISSEVPGAQRLSLRMLSPEGKEVARYFRQQPDTPPLNAYLYNGKAHLLPGKGPCVVGTPFARVGLQICSELFVPELARLSMLEGAEILVSPVHGLHSRSGFNPAAVRDTWRCVARARAAENIMYVLVTQNLYKVEGVDYGRQVISGAMVAGPEEMVAFLDRPGVLAADLDLERLRYLRSRNYDEENLSRPDDPNWRPLGCRPGQLYERYPELYKKLTEPSPFSFNYHYWQKGLDAWQEEYDRIYEGDYKRIEKRRKAPLQFTKV